MNVYLIPTFSEENDYLKNITEGLTLNGVNVISKKNRNKLTAPLDSVINSIKHEDYIVHFNWIENKVNHPGLKGRLNYAAIRMWIWLLKKTGAKICWTMHNKMPHSNTENSLSTTFYSYFLHRCDMIMVHCKESEKILQEEYHYSGRILNVPHGNYCKSQADADFSSMNNRQFLYFGAVSRYKNIPVLINAYKEVVKEYPDIRLKICGKCKDSDLDKEINDLVSNNKGISYINKFLDDDELNQELNNCCAVILPYDKTSMLNSGSAIMAFSKGRSVIIPDFGYITDIREKPFVHCYDFSNTEDHADSLAGTWKRAILCEEQDSCYWRKVGMDAFLFAKNNLDWSEICKEIARNYELL